MSKEMEELYHRPEYMDWSTNFVSRLERGCTMTSVCKLCKLANVLDTTVSAFFY